MKLSKNILLLISLLAMLFINAIYADIATTDDSNNKRAIEQYLQLHPVNLAVLQNTIEQHLRVWQKPSDTALADAAKEPTSPLLPDLFPMVTLAMTPGIVNKKTLSQHLPHAFFVMGDDMLSIAWFKKNQAMLAAHHATGIVVAVASEEHFAALQTLAAGLPLHKLPGDSLAAMLQVQHYPFFIIDNTLAQ